MGAVDFKPRNLALAESKPLTRHAFAETFRRSQHRVKFQTKWLETQAETELEQHALAFAKAEAEPLLPDLVRRIVYEARSCDATADFLRGEGRIPGRSKKMLKATVHMLLTSQGTRQYSPLATPMCGRNVG